MKVLVCDLNEKGGIDYGRDDIVAAVKGDCYY